MSVNQNLYIEDTFNETKDIKVNIDRCVTFQPKKICLKTENTKITKYFSIKYIHFLHTNEIYFKITCLNPEIHFCLKVIIKIPEVRSFGLDTQDLEFKPDPEKKSSAKILYLYTFEEVHQQFADKNPPEVLFRFFFIKYTPILQNPSQNSNLSSEINDIPHIDY